MPDKILVTNCAALKKKYGDQGFKDIRTAIGALVAADKARGLSTQLFDISDAAKMKTVKGAADHGDRPRGRRHVRHDGMAERKGS